MLKDEIKLTYNKVITSLETNPRFSAFKENENILPNQDLLKENIIEETFTKIENPGVLKVVKKIETSVSGVVNNHELSSSNIIKETNQNRKVNGNLTELKQNSQLNFSAEKKLQDMFVKQYFEHNSPSGVGIKDLGSEIGYKYILIGENLALGNFDSDKALVDAWMASPGHRANILNKKYSEIGVAVGQGQYNGRNVWMAVSHFGLPQSACPTIDRVLYGIIQLSEQEIKKLTVDLFERHEKINKGGVYGGKTSNEQIDEYNITVVHYNNLISLMKERINNYNQQVKNFNICITDNIN